MTKETKPQRSQAPGNRIEGVGKERFMIDLRQKVK